ncbi:unnamed protein product [Rotaria magnacalcarata]|uniref:Uncharacterized protein n=1 Tax=Rotaria magnacalcarata TaxID=392030 RepID=A0A816RFK5_9BILA|nr:unnamed protein product [Rotaria magnacalcarata]CAF2087900.1 unnamed protein product [Rotaria magnacalcarata]
MSSNFVKFFIVLVTIQQTAFGLKCYDCNRGTDGCGISFNSKGAGVIEDAATESNIQCVVSSYLYSFIVRLFSLAENRTSQQ